MTLTTPETIEAGFTYHVQIAGGASHHDKSSGVEIDFDHP
jgi:hypothetical protein